MADSQDVPQAEPQEPAAESSPETQAPEPKEEQPKEKADPILAELSDEPVKESEPKPEPKAEEPKEEPKPKSEEKPEGELKPKSENRFQKLANENRELREQIEAAKQRDAQLAAEQQLLEGEDPETGQPYSAEDAARIARYQSIEQERQQNQWQQHQLTLSAESMQIMNDYPIFNESSPEFRPELAEKAAQALEPYLIRDQQGQVIGSNVSPSAIYKPIADAYELAKTQGQITGQRQTEQMIGNTDPSTSASPTKRRTDPVLEFLSSDD
jgi:hypothetical protein